MTERTATFTKFEDQWMILIDRDQWEMGAEVTVTSRKGSKVVTCGDWFEERPDNKFAAAFIDPTPKPERKPAARKTATRRRATSGRPSNLASPKQIAFLNKLIKENARGGAIMLSDGGLEIPANLSALTKAEASDLIGQILDGAM